MTILKVPRSQQDFYFGIMQLFLAENVVSH